MRPASFRQDHSTPALLLCDLLLIPAHLDQSAGHLRSRSQRVDALVELEFRLERLQGDEAAVAGHFEVTGKLLSLQ